METDITLLNAVRELNKEALIKTFDLYSSAIYNYALRVCGDHVMADHIVGDVFVKLLDQLSAGNGPNNNLRSYLFQTAHNLIIDQARSSRRIIPLEAADSLRPDLHSSILGLENRIMFERILNTIQSDVTEDQRHVIILRYLEGFSLRETSVIMGITVAHVKVIQNRAIAKIRQTLNYDEIMTTVACANVRKLSKTLGIR